MAAYPDVVWRASIRVVARMHHENNALMWQRPLTMRGVETLHDGIGMDSMLEVCSLGPHTIRSLWIEARRADKMQTDVLACLSPVCKRLDVIKSFQSLG